MLMPWRSINDCIWEFCYSYLYIIITHKSKGACKLIEVVEYNRQGNRPIPIEELKQNTFPGTGVKLTGVLRMISKLANFETIFNGFGGGKKKVEMTRYLLCNILVQIFRAHVKNQRNSIPADFTRGSEWIDWKKQESELLTELHCPLHTIFLDPVTSERRLVG